MKQIRHIIKNEEKEILTNFFLQQGMNSRQNYLKWLADFFAGYGTFKTKDRKESVFSADYSIDMIWDASTNTSLIQHFLRHPKYNHSNSLFRNFKKFHSNLNHLDNNGNNIIHDAAQHNYFLLNQLLNEDDTVKNVINNDGKTYHMIMVDNFDVKNLLPNFQVNNLRDMSVRIRLTNMILINLTNFIDNRIKDVVDTVKLQEFINKNEKISTEIEKMWQSEAPNIRAEAYNECIQEVTDFKNKLMFLKLACILEEKPDTPKIKI